MADLPPAHDFLLPGEIMDATGVPDDARLQVAYMIATAKYCALVEAVMKLTGGEPVRMSLERVKEIASMDESTDPRVVPMVAEDPIGAADVLVHIASVEQIEAANRRSLLQKMGTQRN